MLFAAADAHLAGTGGSGAAAAEVPFAAADARAAGKRRKGAAADKVEYAAADARAAGQRRRRFVHAGWAVSPAYLHFGAIRLLPRGLHEPGSRIAPDRSQNVSAHALLHVSGPGMALVFAMVGGAVHLAVHLAVELAVQLAVELLVRVSPLQRSPIPVPGTCV